MVVKVSDSEDCELGDSGGGVGSGKPGLGGGDFGTGGSDYGLGGGDSGLGGGVGRKGTVATLVLGVGLGGGGGGPGGGPGGAGGCAVLSLGSDWLSQVSVPCGQGSVLGSCVSDRSSNLGGFLGASGTVCKSGKSVKSA